MSSGPLALLLENIHPEAVRAFTESGFEVETLATSLSGSELAERVKDVTVLGIRSKTNVTAEILTAAPNLLAVGAFCIGTDQIDINAAARTGIAVFNAPYSNTRSVVELTLSEIIALARRLPEKTEQMHAGVWDKSADGSHEVRGRTLGIVGYGNIGSQLSIVAEALGMQVLFFDPADKLALGNARRCLTLDEVLRESDVVTLHVDGRPSNDNFFGEEQFAQMRSGALFLNLSRGFVIDHDALAASLRSGHIGGAAVDVFEEEPAGKSKEFQSVLRGIPNVILTPHIGGSTEEAQTDIGRFVSSKLIDFVFNGSTSMSIDMPLVTPQQREGTLRIAHLHKNIPGVMAEINAVFAQRGINVEAQSLSTRGDLGYVVTDVSVEKPDVADELSEVLQALPATVRLRVLR